MSSPTARTIGWLRDRGYACGSTERFNTYTKQRNDLFGFIDLVAISANWTIGVQATSGANVAHRIEKIKALEAAPLWLAQPGRRIWVIGWRKGGAAGTRKLWTVRIVEMRYESGEWSQEELLASEMPRTASIRKTKTGSSSTVARKTKKHGSDSSGMETGLPLIDVMNSFSVPSPSAS